MCDVTSVETSPSTLALPWSPDSATALSLLHSGRRETGEKAECDIAVSELPIGTTGPES